MNFLEFWNTQCFFFLEFWRIPRKKTRFFWNLIQKPLKNPRFFLEFHNKFQKRPWIFQGFLPKFQKKARVFLNFEEFRKNLGFSKIPKIFGEIDEFFGVLEFWKTQCCFGILKNSKNTLVFFVFDPKTLKKTRYFWNFIINSKKKPWVFQGFLPTFQKNLGSFWILKNSKKNLGFPKFQKYLGRLMNFLEFWKTQCFFFWILKNSKNTLGFLEFDPKTLKNPKVFFGIS